MEKTLQEIGYEYELYVGAMYEALGFDVDYCGIREKIYDNGRDLICKKDDKVYIVQCKRYKPGNLIHYDVVDRIYATAIRYGKEHNIPQENIVPVVVTSSKLAQDALISARDLGVSYRDNLVYKQEEFVKLRMQIAEKRTRQSEVQLDEDIKIAEEKLRLAETKAEAAEQKAKIAIVRAKKAEAMAIAAENALNEAEEKAKKYKIAQLASLEKTRSVLNELEATKVEAEERIKKEISARLRAEANSKKSVKEIEKEIALITSKIEDEAKSKIESIREAAQNEIDQAAERVKAAELEKKAAEAIAKAAEAEKLAEIEKSKKAQQDAKKMSLLAENAVKFAEKAHEDMELKSSDAENAIKASRKAEERVKTAERSTKEAEERAYEAERKLQDALDETNRLKLLLIEKETELREKFDEELGLREKIQCRRIEILEEQLKKEQEDNLLLEDKAMARMQQIELWTMASGNNNTEEYSAFPLDSSNSKGYEARIEAEYKLNKIDQEIAMSKLLSKKIKVEIEKIGYAKGKITINLLAYNNNDVEVDVVSIILKVVLHHKSTGIKLFESSYDVRGTVINRLSSNKIKCVFKNIKFYYDDDRFNNKFLDWSSSIAIVKLVTSKCE